MAGFAGTEEERLALRTFVRLVRTANALSARLHRPLAEVGLTESQFGVLEAILHLGPLAHRELAEKILRSNGNVTLVVDQLEKRELVRRERAGEDRRTVRVHLTDAGRSLVSNLFPAHAARLALEMSVLDAPQQRELVRLCRRLQAGDEGPGESGAMQDEEQS